jgi:hypothetical protein
MIVLQIQSFGPSLRYGVPVPYTVRSCLCPIPERVSSVITTSLNIFTRMSSIIEIARQGDSRASHFTVKFFTGGIERNSEEQMSRDLSTDNGG